MGVEALNLEVQQVQEVERRGLCMNEIVLKRKLAESVQLIVKSSAPHMAGIGGTIDALGSLLSLWTGKEVRVTLSAKGESESLDMVKSPDVGATH